MSHKVQQGAATLPIPREKTPSRAIPRYSARFLARKISSITCYADQLIQVGKLPHDPGILLEALEGPTTRSSCNTESFPNLSANHEDRTTVLFNATFNHHLDIQSLLSSLHSKVNRHTRFAVILYNPYLRQIYALATRMGLRKGPVPTTFLTRVNLEDIARLSGYEVIAVRPGIFCPYSLLGLGSLINRLFYYLPWIRRLPLNTIAVLRPLIPSKTSPSLTIVIPARNEAGNIENALKRMPQFGSPQNPAQIEIIFVEGNSTDQTWEEIQRVAQAYQDRFKIRCYQQSGRGKADAVRLGFSKAQHDLLTILDADLTMPPEDLVKFYNAYTAGHADFINGSRLVYPMEGESMRFLNLLGNVFFAKGLSLVLETRLGDSLCGTKLLSRRDYSRFIDWRRDFGDFDPFGDFELIFPAAFLGLGIVDIPIRYRARTYGTTNIRRFRDGLKLFKMLAIGLMSRFLS